MRRGLFGLISTAAIIATAAVGCSTGGGGSEDYDLPDIPGTTPTASVMEFTLESYGSTDKALMMVVNAGKKADDIWGKDVKLTSVYSTPDAAAKTATCSKAAAVKNKVNADEEEQDYSVDYLCGYSESLDRFSNLVRPDAESDPSVILPSDPQWDGKEVGTIAPVYPPSALSSSQRYDGQINVMKVLSDDASGQCNLLVQVGEDKTSDVSENLCKDIATVFGIGSDSVHSIVTKAFGSEWKYTPTGGLDGDTSVNIVLCDNTAMNGHCGAVRFCDCFKKKNVYTSNEGEYIFINKDILRDSSGSWKESADPLIKDVLAHQLTHLIEMNNKVIHEGAFTGFKLGETSAKEAVETTGLSEGYAQIAGEMCDGGVSGARNEYKGAEVNSFDDIKEYMGGTFDPSRGNIVFPQSIFSREQGNYSQNIYGGSHMFMLYLLENFGIKAIGNMMQSSKTGMSNVAMFADKDADVLFCNYCRAVLLSQYDGLPESGDFSFIKVGGTNYVVEDKVISDDELPGIPALYNYGVTNEETFTMSPWTSRVIGFKGGKDAGKNLVIDVEYPTLGNVYVWRMNNDGTFGSEIKGVELKPQKDR